MLVQVLDKVVTVVSGQVVVSLTTFILFYGGFVILLVYSFIFEAVAVRYTLTYVQILLASYFRSWYNVLIV